MFFLDFFLDNCDIGSVAELYPLEDINLSLSSKEGPSIPTGTPDSAKDLDWQFNEQFQELSTIPEVQVGDMLRCLSQFQKFCCKIQYDLMPGYQI